MKIEKTIGYLLVIGALGVTAPFALLATTFNYPGILRSETSVILQTFHAGGSWLIGTWLAFALGGFPLLVVYPLLGRYLSKVSVHMSWITTLGVLSGIVQIIGLLRWVFVVPMLATEFANATDAQTKISIVSSFKLIHQFAGVLLGEHLGQLLTVAWTVAITPVLVRLKLIPTWMGWFGYSASVVYLLAQTELLATVLPGMPVIGFASLAGSTAWLAWLVLVGVSFILKKQPRDSGHNFY